MESRQTWLGTASCQLAAFEFSAIAPALLYLLHPCSRHKGTSINRNLNHHTVKVLKDYLSIWNKLPDKCKQQACVECSNIKHNAAPCNQDFTLHSAKNSMVSVQYRIDFLPQWCEIQESVTKVILGFAIDPKKIDNKIANKPLTQSGD